VYSNHDNVSKNGAKFIQQELSSVLKVKLPALNLNLNVRQGATKVGDDSDGGFNV